MKKVISSKESLYLKFRSKRWYSRDPLFRQIIPSVLDCVEKKIRNKFNRYSIRSHNSVLYSINVVSKRAQMYPEHTQYSVCYCKEFNDIILSINMRKYYLS